MPQIYFFSSILCAYKNSSANLDINIDHSDNPWFIKSLINVLS